MELLETKQLIETPVSVPTPTQTPEKEFKPTGAVAFFVLLVIVGLTIWFGIYFLMLNRN